MAVTDKKAHRFALHIKRVIELRIPSGPISQAAVTWDALIPIQAALKAVGQAPYYLVEAVEVFTRAIVATAQVDVKIGATSVLTGLITPVAGTPTVGAVVAAIASRIIKAGDVLNGVLTTNGTGTLTDCVIRVTVRAFPASEEAYN